jgi:hypothetical protein
MPPKGKAKDRKFTAAQVDAGADRLARLANDRTLIPGVYNYCDRWCERCPLTARCLVYKTEQVRNRKRGGRTASHDIKNQEFWDDLAENFALTMHLVRREAKAREIDLDSPEIMVEAAAEARKRRRRAAREGSALHRAATAYRKTAKALLERLPEELRATEDALNTQIRLEAGDPYGAAAVIHDALEVVEWYLLFIDVKLSRAVAGRVDEAIDGDDGYPSDADGSAKVALVAIDRSISAWARLREHLGSEADAMLDLLVRLERLRRAVEGGFPQARTFKRPGFDGTP